MFQVGCFFSNGTKGEGESNFATYLLCTLLVLLQYGGKIHITDCYFISTYELCCEVKDDKKTLIYYRFWFQQ